MDYGNTIDYPAHTFYGNVTLNGNLVLGTDKALTFDEHATAPSTPAAGAVVLYAKADGKLYSKDDAGAETALGGASDGDKGDVTVSASGATWTIDNDAVTYAKMQNVSATSRVLGRKTAAAGDVEECTLSEILDFIGSAAQGDILYRGASSWARLGAGTAGQILQTGGTGANPSWATVTAVEGPTYSVVKASDTTVINSTTLADDPDLQVALEAGETYEFEFVVFVGTGATGDCKFDLNFTGTATTRYQYFWTGATLGTTDTNQTALELNAWNTSQALTAASALSLVLQIRGYVTPTVAGTLSYRFAQNTLHATDAATAKTGSTLIVRKVLNGWSTSFSPAIGTTTLGSDSTSMASTTIDLDANGDYEFSVSATNALASTVDLYFYCNADTTNSNYDAQRVSWDSVQGIGQTATPQIGSFTASCDMELRGRIGRSKQGYVYIKWKGHRNSSTGASVAGLDGTVVWNTLSTNVTSIQLYAGTANAIASGSELKIWIAPV